ncbi:putative tetratricopeptide-like helical domain superfamily [Dioscorea sansibarensis]
MHLRAPFVGKMLPLLINSVGSRRISSVCRKEMAFGNVYTTEGFASHLEACVDVGSLRKLVNCYANAGAFWESRLAFDSIINRNLSLWNSAIVGYFRAGYFEEVLRLYSCLKMQGIGIDSSAIVFGLKSCHELGMMDFGRGIHGDAYKVGIHGDKFIGPSLVKLYFKCGIMEDAERVFEEIFEKDIVAYTSMITGYAQQAGFHVIKAFQTACEMHREGLDANRVSLVSLLQAAGKVEALHEGRSIHGYALRRGIDLSEEVLETSLVDMYAKCGAKVEAVSFLRQMRRSVASWNALIAGVISYDCDRSSEALHLFYQMVHQEGLWPNSITLANVLSACCESTCAHLVTSIHGYILRRELPLDLVVTTALIDCYSRCGKVHNARELFDRLRVRDTVLFNVIISAHLRHGAIDEVIKMLNWMVEEGLSPNTVTLLVLLSGFADLEDLRRGRCIHGCVLRQGLQTDIDVSNQILHMYTKCASIDVARKFFDSMTNKDLVSFTTMMMGYINQGHADEILALFRLMQRTGENPDSVTLITLTQALSLLSLLAQIKEIQGHVYRIWLERDSAITSALIMAYAKCGRLDLAELIFSNVEERTLNLWNTMMSAYGMHGYCREALELFHHLQNQNLRPDGLTFSTVLSACSHAGLVEEGRDIFNSMKSRYSMALQEEHYSCIVDLLGRAGHLEEAYEFVNCSPLRNKTSALSALLGACRVHRNTQLGEMIGMQLLELDPQNSSAFAMVSNVYAEAGKWCDAATLRLVARERGLKKMPGYSLVESEVHPYTTHMKSYKEN